MVPGPGAPVTVVRRGSAVVDSPTSARAARRRRTETLKVAGDHRTDMEVTVEVVGEGEQAVDVEEGATYAALCRAVGYSPHEVSVLVDGRPVPEDRPVEAARVRVLRLVRGG
jgi:sulfur carrier protein